MNKDTLRNQLFAGLIILLIAGAISYTKLDKLNEFFASLQPTYELSNENIEQTYPLENEGSSGIPEGSSFDCGNSICEEDKNENRINCIQDCRFHIFGDEKVLKQDNIMVIYSPEFDDEFARIQLNDKATCIKKISELTNYEMPDNPDKKYEIVFEFDDFSGDTLTYYDQYGMYFSFDKIGYERRYKLIKDAEEEINNGLCYDSWWIINTFMDFTMPYWSSSGLYSYLRYGLDDNIVKPTCKGTTIKYPVFNTETNEFDEVENEYAKLLENGHGLDDLNITEEQLEHESFTQHCFWIYLQQQFGHNTVMNIVKELKKQKSEISTKMIFDTIKELTGRDITDITKHRFGIPN